MRFKQFIIIEQIQLNEAGSEGDFTIKELSDEEWVAWVTQNCGDYLPRAGKHPIYRGFPRKTATVKLGIKNTNEFTRRSVGTPNYFLLWIDNATQWKNFPKRSRSYIGSSNFRTASDFGQPYQLFPANDAKIGICPKKDIWFSFNQIPGDIVHEFVIFLQIAFEKVFGNAAAKRAETDWIELRQLLEGITTNEFINLTKDDLNYYIIPKQFTRYPTLIDYFENEIVPGKHGFKHATPATYSVTNIEDKEVWVQGKVALLKVDSVFNSNHLFPRTTALLSQYNIENPY